MMRELVAGLIATGLMAGCAMDDSSRSASADRSSGETVTVPLQTLNNSGESGTATLSADGNQTRVVIQLSGAPQGVAQPAHIHAGTCGNLERAPKHGLTNVMNGNSTTMVPAELSTIMSGTNAIAVHKSKDEMKTYVACGNLSRG